MAPRMMQKYLVQSLSVDDQQLPCLNEYIITCFDPDGVKVDTRGQSMPVEGQRMNPVIIIRIPDDGNGHSQHIMYNHHD